MSDDGKKLSKALDDPLTSSRDPNKKEWVKFEEEDVETGATSSQKVFFNLACFLHANFLKTFQWVIFFQTK